MANEQALILVQQQVIEKLQRYKTANTWLAKDEYSDFRAYKCLTCGLHSLSTTEGAVVCFFHRRRYHFSCCTYGYCPLCSKDKEISRSCFGVKYCYQDGCKSVEEWQDHLLKCYPCGVKYAK